MILKTLGAAIVALSLAAGSADAAMTLRPHLSMQVKSAHGLVGQKVTLLKAKSLAKLLQERHSYRRKSR